MNKENEGPESKKSKYVLRLYVAGTSRKSLRAIQNIKKLLDEELGGQYELEIIDIYQQPIFAKSGQIVAAPTLIKELPEPLRRLVGDLSDTSKVLAGLDLSPRE
ncbi:MAG: circadian clock KaiB family protein [Desulfomonilaceae bacterium]